MQYTLNICISEQVFQIKFEKSPSFCANIHPFKCTYYTLYDAVLLF